MRKYLNGTGVPLSVAVFLASDDYDYDPDTISATKLIKPIRQLILSSRVPPEENLIDISGLVKARIGQAIHSAIEHAWKHNVQRAMTDLGYPAEVSKRVRINPDPDKVEPGDIPVYLEQREKRAINGEVVSGKYDFVAEGRVEDFKSTGVFSYTSGTKDEDYKLQGSIYRWLNPKIITDDVMAVNFLLTDHMAARAGTDPSYPATSTPRRLIPLLSVEETEEYIVSKLNQVKKYQHMDEQSLPPCTDADLWRKETVWKYFKNPKKRNRATKNFDTPQGAYQRLAEDGNVGVVEEVPGEVVACKYCLAFTICTQKDDLLANGQLKL